MTTVKRFEELDIWKSARKICQEINKLASNKPFCRDFSLVDQIKRSSGSIMDNIAEGFERDGRNEFVQFLSISKGSAGETRSQLYRAFDNKYISEDDLERLNKDLIHLSSQIQNMINYLKKSQYKGTKFKDKPK